MKHWKGKPARIGRLSMATILVAGMVLPQGLAITAQAAVSSHVVISQVYGGGGNTNSSYKNDFIELYNPTDQAVTLDGMSVQYSSATGTNTWTYITPLTGTIQPHKYLLVQEAAGSNASQALPTPDVTGTFNMAATGGKVALVNGTTGIKSSTDATVIDFLGFGSANDFQTAKATAPASGDNKSSIVRKTNSGNDPLTTTTDGNGWSTNDNSSDFVLNATPQPHNSSSAASPAQASTDSVTPNGNAIQFTASGQSGQLTGDTGAVTAGSSVSVYGADPTGGTSPATLATGTADSNGGFSLTFDPQSATSVYVTATDAGKTVSAPMKIDVAQEAPALVDTGLSYTIDSSGNGTLTGQAADGAYVYVYSDNSGTPDKRIQNAGVDHAVAAVGGSFSYHFTNAPDTIYVSQMTSSANGRSLESTLTSVTKQDNPTPPTDTVVPIASLRVNQTDGSPSNKGQTYTVEGVATVDNNVMGTGAYNFYLQDASGGIDVYLVSGTPTPVKKGDKLRVTGTIDFYHGLTEFVPTAVESLGAGGTVMDPVKETIADLNSYSKAEPNEGSLVSVTGKVTSQTAAGSNYNYTLVDDKGNAITVRLLATSNIAPASSLELNKSYTITGALSQYVAAAPYTSGYQVIPRSTDDIAVYNVLTLQHQPLTQVVKNVDLNFQAVATGASAVNLYYKATGDSTYQSLPMTSTDNTNYTVSLPSAQVPAPSFQYYIEATAGAQAQDAGSSTTPYAVNVIDDTAGPTFGEEVPVDGLKVEDYRPDIALKFADPSGVDTSTVKVTLDGNDVTSQATVQADGISLTLASDLAVGTHTVDVAANDKVGNANSYHWSFEVVPPFQGGNHYRGTTHNHTQISHDGAGAPEDALKAAKAHGYDFFAFSDHSHDIDPELVGKDTVDHNGMPERTGGNEWQLTKQLADQYTNNGSFVVFPAFEMTSTTWGHSNVFGTDNFIDRKQNNGMYQDLNKYYGWVMTYDDIAAQFNHPDMSANAFNNFTPYDQQLDKLFTMLEVGNGSGTYGYANAEEKFFSALDLGWHVAPTFGEDNHDATWGETKKRTIIVADDLSQASLLHSMRNMRVYMSEDPNFTLDVFANGLYMGSTVNSKSLNFTIKGKDPVQEEHTMPEYSYIPANVHSDDRIAKVELITNGDKVVDTYTPDESSTATDFNWSPKYTVTGGQQWFVVKVTQKDGDRVYSSPIWTPEVATDVKVSGLNVAGAAMVGGAPAQLQAGISNMGTQNLSGLGVHFYYDSVDADHLIGSTTIAALNSKSVTTANVTWKNPVPGNHTLLAVVDTPNGDSPSDNQFSLPVQIKAPLGMTVMIDASHKNENTTTDTSTYKDNLKSFTQMLQNEGYTVLENTQALTDQVLQGVKVLLLTHPNVKLTADEKTAVANFVKNGGSLALMEKSNFSADPTTDNDLLQQLGSSIQVNSDGINDDSKTGNFWSNQTYKFAVRLHPGLVRNYITDRVIGLDYYSGSSLEKVGHQALTDSDTVTILASGNDTTYQSGIKNGGYAYDTVSDTTGGSAIPAVASEQVGSGRVVVAGMDFLNDKQLDESFEDKGNNEFAMNAFNWLAHRDTTVTTIADARKLSDDTDAVIEGTVTSGAGNYFDAFYLQDATGGIMAFNEVPDGSLQVGDTVRVYGHLKTFENNKEFEFGPFALDVIKTGHKDAIVPQPMKTGDALKEENQGLLVKVSGKVVSQFDDNSYVINDGSGPVLVFTDGYIVNESGVPVPKMKVGDTYDAVGFTGKYSGGNRIRVRDTRELSTTPAPVDNGGGGNTNNGGDHSNGNGKGINVQTNHDDKGRTILKAVVDDTTLNGMIDGMSQAGSNKSVVLNVPGTGDQIQTQLSASAFGRAVGQATGASIAIQSDLGTLTLPAQALQDALGHSGVTLSNSTVNVTLTKADASTEQNAKTHLQQAGATLLTTPVDFTIDVTDADGKKQEINNLSSYLAHALTVQAAGADTKNLIGVMIDPTTGEYTPLPTSFSEVNGQLIGTIYRKGNSMYAVVENHKSFGDVATNSYAKESIDTLASKFILHGFEDGNYHPNANVTRAEFAAMLVRALGIQTPAVTSSKFSDVQSGAWYVNTIEAAAKAGLVNGYADSSFHPNEMISRQEMALMITNALQTSGRYTATLSDSEINTQLASFTDGAKVPQYARKAMATAVKEGILKGTDNNVLSLNLSADRAQSAAILYRTLHTLDLMN